MTRTITQSKDKPRQHIPPVSMHSVHQASRKLATCASRPCDAVYRMNYCRMAPAGSALHRPLVESSKLWCEEVRALYGASYMSKLVKGLERVKSDYDALIAQKNARA